MESSRATWADRVLARSPAQPVFRWRAARRLAVLAYHSVHDAERFGDHLDWLQAHAHVVSLDEVIDARRRGQRLPPRAVLVTFDDGYADLYDTGFPLLHGRDVPAVAFVVAGAIDGDQPFWWDEVTDLMGAGGHVAGPNGGSVADVVRAMKAVDDDRRLAMLDELRATASRPARPVRHLSAGNLRELDASGVTIGNHTVTHPCLPRCAIAKGGTELRDAHRTLTDVLGRSPRAFAWPNGDVDVRLEPVLRELGYEIGFAFDHQLAAPDDGDFTVSRLRVNASTSLDRFRTILSGLHPAVHRARGGR